MADFIIDLKIWPQTPLKNSNRLSKVSDGCLLFRRGVFIVNQWFLVKSRKSKYITTNYQHDQVQNAPLELFDQVHDPPPQGGLWAVLGHNHCHGGCLVSHFVAGNHHDHHRNHHRNHHDHHHNSLNDQAIQWMRNPTPQSKLKSFEPFNCNYAHRPPRCSSPKVTIQLLCTSCQPPCWWRGHVIYAIHSALLLVGVSREVEELFQLVAEWQRQRKL